MISLYSEKHKVEAKLQLSILRLFQVRTEE